MIPNVKLFKILFIDLTLFDLLDILLLTFIFYKLYFFLRGSRAAQMAAGLVVILIVSILAQLFNMQAITWLFQNLKTVWLILFVIIFQPELRRMLTNLGQSRLVRYLVRVSESKVVDQLLQAVETLSSKRYGGLIVITRNTGLKAIIETGIRIEAEVSAPLLISIFNPRSPLHDGAVIIQGEVIKAAKCILPLSSELKNDSGLGTRHRAGLGMSEESDAFVVIVSEETGRISVAFNGELIRNVPLSQLESMLQEALKINTMQ